MINRQTEAIFARPRFVSAGDGMELPVEFNKDIRTARVVFADPREFCFLDEWQEKLGNDTNPVRTDAVNFAHLAVNRISAHSEIQSYAKSIEEIGDYVNNNPRDEVACFVLLKCDWFLDSGVIGICHFRRSWANRIILDYLAAHPFIAKKPEGYHHEVRGVGSVLLYFVCKIAERFECGGLWGEATPMSHNYYKKALKLDSVEDLIFADRVKLTEYITRCDKLWSERSGSTSIQEPSLEELYKLEVLNPPFVGSKTAVFIPSRRLASRFLALPSHEQIKIAKILALLSEAESGQANMELFRRLFAHAVKSGRLADLWREVESRHSDGEPDENPFLRK